MLFRSGQKTNWNPGRLPNGGRIAEDGRYIPAPSEAGNIDLSKRNGVTLPDGSTATIRSSSFNIDGKEVLIPTIGPNGENWDPDTPQGRQAAIDHYNKTGQHLGKFNSVEEADVYGEWLHQQEEKRINNLQRSNNQSNRPRQTTSSGDVAPNRNRDRATPPTTPPSIFTPLADKPRTGWLSPYFAGDYAHDPND